MTEFLNTFTTVVRKESTELLLQTHTQPHDEGIVVFVEEMKSLFRRAGPDMTEDKKLRFLMRSVKEELLAGVVRNPIKTVAEFLSEAATIEKTLDIRKRQYDRLASLVMVSQMNAVTCCARPTSQ